jgi:hypothetical protein
MDYTHNPAGMIEIFGCADVSAAATFVSKYPVGSILYDVNKARKGLLRKHCVKKINEWQIYIDTFNAAFMEDELIPYDQAVVIAQRALELIEAKRREAIKENCQY